MSIASSRARNPRTSRSSNRPGSAIHLKTAKAFGLAADTADAVIELLVRSAQSGVKPDAFNLLVYTANMPLTIVVHGFPGHRVVLRPTLGAIGNVSVARYRGADACSIAAEPTAAFFCLRLSRG